jgi:flagellin-like hook-associated protein FlgL
MSQKVIANFAYKAEDTALNKNSTNQETDIKSLDQALHNVLLGREIITLVERAYGQIEAILSQVKHWVSLVLFSDLEDTQKTILEFRIFLRLRELDMMAETLTHKGQNLLDGTLSAALDTNSHSFLLVGAIRIPENRINLNTSLNIPSISSKNLELGELSINSQQHGLKGLMMLENALSIITGLKQRSTALATHLKKINQHLSIAMENHHAANTALNSSWQTQDFISVSTYFIKNNKSKG